MSEEEIKKIAREEMLDIIKSKLDSSMIFTYINNLEQENKQLKEVVENLTTMTVYGDRKQIKNTAQYKLELAEQRIDKAIEEINYMITNADITEISAIKLKQILGEKENE